MYNLFKAFLFLFDPEVIHRLTILFLKFIPLYKTLIPKELNTKIFGLNFSSPIGLAAGFDKNAEVYGKILNLGFGFVEVGTVTPRPQKGNPKPRIHRIKKERAIINSLGFNSIGFEKVKANLLNKKTEGIIGVNIGANKDSKIFIDDYISGIKFFSNHVSYITINISSPNTPGLRELHIEKNLKDLLEKIKSLKTNNEIAEVPLLIKISPDVNDDDLSVMCDIFLEFNVDGIIISNTTLERPFKGFGENLKGGLSGELLYQASTNQLKRVYEYTKGQIPLIVVGGIISAKDAYNKIRNGASLVQLYTGIVYHGPGLIKKMNSEISALLKNDGFDSISDAVGIDTEIKNGT